MLTSLNLFVFAIGAGAFWSNINSHVIILGFTGLLLCVFLWLRDVTIEGGYLGNHTSKVIDGLNMGFILFIVSEIALFFSFFWAYLHSALVPTVDIGCVWPPVGIEAISPVDLPLLGSIILLTSSFTVTSSHYYMIAGKRSGGNLFLIFTILLGAIFTKIQLIEYDLSTFTISDGIYGSLFFTATGLHGVHILIGTLMLIVSLFITMLYINTNEVHTGFKVSILYWHFVDMLWAFIYGILYIWVYMS